MKKFLPFAAALLLLAAMILGMTALAAEDHGSNTSYDGARFVCGMSRFEGDARS